MGGTNVVTAHDVGTLDSAYAGENAWYDPEADADPYGFGQTVTGKVWGAGGGASVIFPADAYQSLVMTGSTMRMTPDVGMQVGGCPGGATDYNPRLGVCNGGNKLNNGAGNTNRSDFTIYFGGGRYGVIGTSVSSPEFTSVVALLVQKNGRMGNLNPYIYQQAAIQAKGGRRSYHTGIPGNNGLIQSNISATFNVSTGVGTPIVKSFLNAGERAGGWHAADGEEPVRERAGPVGCSAGAPDREQKVLGSFFKKGTSSFLRLHLRPGMPRPRQQSICAGRPGRSRFIGFRGATCVLQRRVHSGPARFDHVRALEQGRIADQAVVEKRLVADIRLQLEGILVGKVQLDRGEHHLRARVLGA